jgi:pimeloyl-ACP methyl ester carboxylesterase
METVSSADGTRIAYDRLGAGPPLIVVGGASCDRGTLRGTAEELSKHFTVLNYDRRGRGDSGDTLPYAVEREIEDLAALIEAAGGRSSVYGHSSGAALALRAAGAGLPFDRIILHDPPFNADGEASRPEATAYADELDATLAEGRNEDALALFMRLTGMPAEMVDGMRAQPWFAGVARIAPTLAYDSAVMGNREAGGGVPLDVVRAVKAPVLVLVGGASPAFMLDVGRRIAEAAPDGRQVTLEGQDHNPDPAVFAPIVRDFAAV